MIEVITGKNAFLYSNTSDQMFRLRHRIFVERMGWEALRQPTGIEKDQFDTPEAVYLVLLDNDETVIGAHRLIPTVRPHLFSEFFSDLCSVKGVQVGSRVYELNRTCVDEERLPKPRQEWARKQIMAGLMEFCLSAGIEKFTVLTPLDVLFRYLLIGWDIKPLGVPREIDGVKQAAVAVSVTENALKSVREAFAIAGPIVNYNGPTAATGKIIEFLPELERESATVN